MEVIYKRLNNKHQQINLMTELFSEMIKEPENYLIDSQNK